VWLPTWTPYSKVVQALFTPSSCTWCPIRMLLEYQLSTANLDRNTLITRLAKPPQKVEARRFRESQGDITTLTNRIES